MGSRQGRELELKLELDPDNALRLMRLKRLVLPRAGPVRLGAARTAPFYSVYYDTSDRALRRAGISFRIRHAGAKRLQTVKTESRSNGLAADRAEDEIVLQGKDPDVAQITDRALQTAVEAALEARSLEPVFATDLLRTTRTVSTKAGDRLAWVIDQGTVSAQGREAPVSEIELELQTGETSVLYDAALALAAIVPVRIARKTKADRGFALLGESQRAPSKARPIKLGAKASVSDALQAVLEACLAHVVANEPAVMIDNNVEGLHQMRVALRRLRAGLATFEPVIDGAALTRVGAEARTIGQTLGAARDLDVFLTDILPRAAAGAGGRNVPWGALRDAAQTAQSEAWRALSDFLRHEAYSTFVLDLAAAGALREFAPAPGTKPRGLKQSARRFAVARLDKHLARAEKLGRKLPALDGEARHSLRKRLKRLRYAGEFFESLFPAKATKRYLKQLSALQDTFGALNDVATASRLVALLAEREPAHAEAIGHAGAEVVAWHQAAAQALEAEATRSWKRLSRLTPFWHAP